MENSTSDAGYIRDGEKRKKMAAMMVLIERSISQAIDAIAKNEKWNVVGSLTSDRTKSNATELSRLDWKSGYLVLGGRRPSTHDSREPRKLVRCSITIGIDGLAPGNRDQQSLRRSSINPWSSAYLLQFSMGSFGFARSQTLRVIWPSVSPACGNSPVMTWAKSLNCQCIGLNKSRINTVKAKLPKL